MLFMLCSLRSKLLYLVLSFRVKLSRPESKCFKCRQQVAGSPFYLFKIVFTHLVSKLSSSWFCSSEQEQHIWFCSSKYMWLIWLQPDTWSGFTSREANAFSGCPLKQGSVITQWHVFQSHWQRNRLLFLAYN